MTCSHVADKQLVVRLCLHLSGAASGASDAPPGWGSAMAHGACRDFLAHWSRMTLRVMQQTHYYENQTRKFLQGQWSRMTLKVIRTWETEIACTASNIRHTIKWTRILARRRLPRPEGTIVRNRDPDVKCGERPPADGGRNPEEVVEALEPSHWRETPSTSVPVEKPHGAFGSGLCTHVAASSRVALLRPRSSSSSPTLLGVALGRGPADQLD